MSLFAQLHRLNNLVIGGYRTVLHGRASRGNWLNLNQSFSYTTRKSAEERLGIEKPKRPLTPFFKFMTQMRPALLAKNPGITSKEAIAWSSKHWQELDAETKSQMTKEYEKDLEDYKKIKKIYDASLTDEQKQEIKRVKEVMTAAREKRKLKAEYKELGRPKKPMSSYFLFMQMKKDALKGNNIKEFQEKVKQEWLKLTENERTKYEKQAQELMNKYKKDLEAWELKMVAKGRSDLVRAKPIAEKRIKSTKKAQ
ncbi:transcription factor A, mitochondrial [Hyposmocoma kahamanoa]|uniref:transcription factor A, mitochondrial n=1 Tax=Hyposmocoma kahamanoa TaxID=1477025 RepID=UPI000E6D5ACA|nr:transcription factor A, mitochondrial [Hyposmocoma kahamanoa]